jgi:translation initiation factor 2D
MLETAPVVIGKLSGGADLMAPGVSDRSIAALPELPAGGLIAISSVAQSDLPRAVGQLAVPSSQLRGDSKGKAVVVVSNSTSHRHSGSCVS